ncbi:SDR family oxidoreductase [Roseomonas sp. OT10]|uniref:SDR family NAD(P)-dependent oxidoreductase n=1 Tax=Roseomonas cutis TaxID=2897332 RepID=UPI001E401037|nr:SDR family NAD(P)-dependent oxidoreductase [Roseomonas sp. OT10]UFN46950.1 SDR family oxidoreductase [Roseomonas sp. OT10]
MIDLRNRRALVTGAGTDGIGRAAARALAAAGARVAVHHLAEPEAAAALAAECGGVALQADLAEPGAAAALPHRAAEALGGLDILVGNAAMLLRKPLTDTSEAEFARVQAVNLAAPFALAREAAAIMRAAGRGGRIVLTSSVNQWMPNPGLVAYGTSKAAIGGLVRQLALELAAEGITVNAVAPGTILTDINRARHGDAEWRAAKLALIPADRLGRPEDVAGVIAFLASDLAAYVTGTTLAVDGGLSLMGMGTRA